MSGASMATSAAPRVAAGGVGGTKAVGTGPGF